VRQGLIARQKAPVGCNPPLLLVANLGKDGNPAAVIAKISQESLAERIGTTRSRVGFFMNKFRKLEFVAYNRGALSVHSSLLNVLLHD
jgi:CRP/FNR family transcriptional regulator, cyclic AMP receptor protein